MLGPLPMSPVLGYWDEFCCLFIWEVSARSTGMKFEKQNQNGGHKLVSFLADVALEILVILLIKLICILLKWKYVQDNNYSILAAMLRKRGHFVLNVLPRLPGLECS